MGQAMVSQKALANAKNTLSAYRTEANDKSKKVLLGLVGNRDAALVSSSFGAWKEICVKAKREAEVRKEYQEELDKAFQALAAFKEKLKGFEDGAKKNAKSVLARMNGNNAAALLSNSFTAWATGIQEEKKQREMEEKVK